MISTEIISLQADSRGEAICLISFPESGDGRANIPDFSFLPDFGRFP